MNNDNDGEIKPNIEREFQEFLVSKQVTGDDNDITHARVGNIKGDSGKYRIGTKKDLKKFQELYIEFCKKYKPNIVERQKEVGPLVTDYDFVFVGNNHLDRKYTIANIMYVVRIINVLLNQYIKIEKDDITAYVTEKDKPTIEYENDGETIKRTKDGFHVTYVLALTKEQRFAIYDKLKEIVINDDGFRNIPFSNTYDKILDESTIYRNGLMMYGSRKMLKKPYSNPYVLTHIFNFNMEEQPVEDYSFADIVKLLCLRQYDTEDQLTTRSSKIEEVEQLMMKYEKTKKKENNGRKESHNQPRESNNYQYKCSERNIKIAKELVKIISPKLADAYDDWTKVGWTMHNIDESLFDDFIEFSKQCSAKYDYDSCVRIWKDARNCGNMTTIGTLHFWAQQNNPKEYGEIIWKNLDKNFINAESGTHADLAKLLYELYRFRFKCSSISKNVWYEFQDHRWVKSEEAVGLRQEIMYNISHKFTDLAISYSNMTKSLDKIEAQMNRNRSDEMNRISKKLQDVPFVTNVIKACAQQFYDAKFEESIDEKHNLIGFKNGVYDLDTELFRHGLPDDNISLSAGYKWKVFKGNEPIFDEINDFLRKIFVDVSLREYVLRFVASCLCGDIPDQKFTFWNGNGCHSGDTQILMHNGDIKLAKDIRIGDYLMGDDSTPRRVGQLFSGIQDMYEITLTDGTSYTVNANHRLALKSTYNGEIWFDDDSKTYVVEYHKLETDGPTKYEKYFKVKDSSDELACKFANEYLRKKLTKPNVIRNGTIFPITVLNYNGLDENIRKYYKNYRNIIDFTQQPVVIDPYRLGNTLGTSQIPAQYKFNSIQIRSKVLAGIIDKFGSIENKKVTLNIPNHSFLKDCISLCRSLGFHVNILNSDKIALTGEFRYLGTKKLNVYLDELNNKHQLMYDFTVKCLGHGRFYGFSVDKNQRYVLQNYIITYNSNGKSMLNALIDKTLGEYCAVIEPTVFTQKRGSPSQAAPELANKRGKRLVITEEAEHDDKLYTSVMKRITGGNKLEVRTLFGFPFSYEPQFKLLFICNDLPIIVANDGGTWRRILVVPFDSKFVENPVAKNHFKMDPTLKKRVGTWKQAFMWLLITKYYKDYVKNGLSEPDSVKLKTKKYQVESDICMEFLETAYIITNNPIDTISVSSFYSAFKNWYKDAYAGDKCQTIHFVKKYFEVSDKNKLINNQITCLKMKRVEEDLLLEATEKSKENDK
jgi:P4 family phage/plasmid primase-like protien